MDNKEKTKEELLLKEIKTLHRQKAKTVQALIETDRRMQEVAQRLKRAQKDFFDNIIQKNVDGVIIVDIRGDICFVNPACEHIFDRKKEELLGIAFGFFLTRDAEEEIQITRKNGEIRIIEAYTAEIFWEEKPAFLVSLRDITERKQMEKELIKHRDHLGELVEERTKELKETHDKLIQSEKLATAAQIASETAHEIKNPLSVIKAGLYYLKTTLPQDQEKIQESIRMLDDAVERATAYIHDLLNFSKPQVLNLMSVEINEVLEKSLKELPTETVANVKIEKDFEPDLPQVKADPERLKHVFINLIKNASESMEGKGKLTIQSKLYEHELQISFTDTGKGIQEEDIKHIFDPFFTTKCKGTGLGLAICHRIIEAHQAEIDVISEVDKGTTFIIRMMV